MGLSVGIFRNFWNCFRIVQVEFLEVGFGFNPGADVFGFCSVFWYHSNLLTNHEGTKKCPVLCGSEIWVILCVIVGKINNMLLCVKFMLICACVMY